MKSIGLPAPFRLSLVSLRPVAVVGILWCLLTVVQAEPVWLTVIGDASARNADTVQVDVTSAIPFNEARLFSVRVNRSADRSGYDGAVYRSYISSVVIDCTQKTAAHRYLQLYSEPLWNGPLRVLKLAESTPQALEFRDMAVNPRDRIIRAACSIDLIKTGTNGRAGT